MGAMSCRFLTAAKGPAFSSVLEAGRSRSWQCNVTSTMPSFSNSRSSCPSAQGSASEVERLFSACTSSTTIDLSDTHLQVQTWAIASPCRGTIGTAPTQKNSQLGQAACQTEKLSFCIQLTRVGPYRFLMKQGYALRSPNHSLFANCWSQAFHGC